MTVRASFRSSGRFRWVEDLTGDLRYALRTLRRSPGFAVTAVLSLAIGIGANSAIFAALDAVLWKPLPVADPQSLVRLGLARPDGGKAEIPGSLLQRLREAHVFADVVSQGADGLSFTLDDRAERIVGEMVSPTYFAMLGVPPILGRGFSADVQAGRWAPETVLAYSFWQQRFAGDPNVIGRVVRLNTYPFTIVGVSPPSFRGVMRGSDFELRIPLLPVGRELPQIHQISGAPNRERMTIARLRPGDGIAQAEAAAIGPVGEFLRTTTLPRFRNAKFRLELSPAARGHAGDLSPFRTPLYLLLMLVAIVLLISCANLASMLLARAATRSRELAMRTAIGASRWRLVRQMVVESVLLALLGGALGVAIAGWASDLLARFLPQGHIRIVVDLHPDARVLIFTFAISLATGLVFGLVPAFQATGGDLASMLRTGAAGSIGDRGARLRKMLVASQVAFSLMLVIAAGVFVRTLADLRPPDYGAHADRVLLFTMKPQQELYTNERKAILAAELVRRVSALPGVQHAALAENGPLGSRDSDAMMETPGQAPVRAGVDIVSRDFFDTLGMRLVAGRLFAASDTPHAPAVIIINQALSRALFPGASPLGRRLRAAASHDVTLEHEYEIVGVVTDTHYYDVHGTPQPMLWIPIEQGSPYMPTLHVRTAVADTAPIVDAVRREFDRIDKGVPVFNIKTLALRIDDSLSRERLVANLSGLFGLMALALAAQGLYGVLAFAVARRTREIGIRMALGSSSGATLWLITREALMLVGMGSAVGLLVTLAASRILSSYLAGVSSMSPGILAGAALTMMLVAAAAVSIPALRACRVDPLVALRSE